MKNKKKSLQLEADRLWYRKYIKDRCEICGSNFALQGHHFYYRHKYSHLRYEGENCITLCKKHHFILHHQDPKGVTDKIVEIRGSEWQEELKKMAQDRPKGSFLTLAYYQGKVEELSR